MDTVSNALSLNPNFLNDILGTNPSPDSHPLSPQKQSKQTEDIEFKWTSFPEAHDDVAHKTQRLSPKAQSANTEDLEFKWSSFPEQHESDVASRSHPQSPHDRVKTSSSTSADPFKTPERDPANMRGLEFQWNAFPETPSEVGVDQSTEAQSSQNGPRKTSRALSKAEMLQTLEDPTLLIKNLDTGAHVPVVEVLKHVDTEETVYEKLQTDFLPANPIFVQQLMKLVAAKNPTIAGYIGVSELDASDASWKSLYCIVHYNFFLMLNHPQDTILTGIIILDHCTVKPAIELTQKANSFVLDTGMERFGLACEDNEQMVAWIQALKLSNYAYIEDRLVAEDIARQNLEEHVKAMAAPVTNVAELKRSGSTSVSARTESLNSLTDAFSAPEEVEYRFFGREGMGRSLF
eukprot:GILK01004312.1.p1 GENE.GILK01004312.1~~GILK01004312.1.p1  ORF type:complete len:405 (-),score=65.99 GILK01004312.1:208-1422(-)